MIIWINPSPPFFKKIELLFGPLPYHNSTDTLYCAGFELFDIVIAPTDPTRTDHTMPTTKSKKEISSNIFKKYDAIRRTHLVNHQDPASTDEWIKEDCDSIRTYNDVYIQLLTKCDLHHTALFKLLNVFRYNSRMCFSRIMTDPYDFVQIPDNIMSYEKADSIATKFSLLPSDEARVKAWLYDHIFFARNQTYIDRTYLLKRFLSVFDTRLVDVFNRLLVSVPGVNGDSTTANNMVTLAELHDVELKIGDTLMSLYPRSCRSNKQETPASDARFVASYESQHTIKFTKKQTSAIQKAVANDFSIVCGYPGTGKSTIADCICHHYKDRLICLTAPTGMAVNNLKKKCPSAEKTIVGTMHKLLYDTFVKEDFVPPSVMIIDEFSMVDNVLFYRILQWCKIFKNKLIILADHQQLPPIGAGDPLGALIASKIFHVTYLKTIKRQKESALKQVVLKLSSEVRPPELLNKSDIDQKSVFFFNFSYDNVRKLIQKYQLDMSNCQFVTPQHKHKEGTVEMNTLLQSIYFPGKTRKRMYPPPGFNSGSVFYDQDHVVRNVNHYGDTGMFANGDIATIQYNTADKSVDVNYTLINQKQQISIMDLYEEFSPAYCLTVHKVQGSEYENVVLVVADSHEFSWTSNDARKLLYTAISRARKRCFILGNPGLMTEAQRSPCHPKASVMLREFNEFSLQ